MFDFVPKYIVVQISAISSYYYTGFIAMNGVTDTGLFPNFGSAASSIRNISITWNNNVVSWYSSESSPSALYQLNVSGIVYYYLAIG